MDTTLARTVGEEPVRQGMQWIAERFFLLSEGQGVKVSPLGWNADTTGIDAPRHHFVVLLNGQRKVITFDNEDLEDLSTDPRVRIMVEGDLRAFLNDELRGSFLID